MDVTEAFPGPLVSQRRLWEWELTPRIHSVSKKIPTLLSVTSSNLN